ncbi:MAG: NADH-quinone oxidoreductase subunit J [Chloroflexota bacterium]
MAETVTYGAFFLLSAVILASALAVVLLRNVLHSALALIATFFAVAGIYVLLEAEFLAAVQVLIYVGAVAVLMLFAIMLTQRVTGTGTKVTNEQVLLAAVVALALFAAVLAPVAWNAAWNVSQGPVIPEAIRELGLQLVTTYALPFEVAAVLLLVALVGAIIIAREA